MLLHCVGAYSRTPTVAALYGAYHRGISTDDALRDVLEALPNAHPNPAFRAALRRLGNHRPPTELTAATSTRPVPRSRKRCPMPENTDDLGEDTPVWQGVLDPSLLNDHVVSAGHRLADAAKAGRLVDRDAPARQTRPPGERQPVAARRAGLVHAPAPGGLARRTHRGRRRTRRPGSTAVVARRPGTQRPRDPAGQRRRGTHRERRCRAT